MKGGMTAARGVVFDSAGHLLVVESGLGITAHTLVSLGSRPKKEKNPLDCVPGADYTTIVPLRL